MENYGGLELSASKRVNWKFQLSPTEVTLLLLFVILFLPTFITLRNISSSLAYSIESLMWRLLFYRDGSVDFRIAPFFYASGPSNEVSVSYSIPKVQQACNN